MDVARTDPILVWGPNGSGTSLYLNALVCWLHVDRLTPRLVVLPANEEASAWVVGRVRPTADGFDVSPRPAAAAQGYDFRLYELAPHTPSAGDAGAHPVAPLRCWSGLPPADAPLPERFASDLRHARGIIVLVGNDAPPRDSAVARTLALLGASAEGRAIPVAACLTDLDAAPEAVRQDAARSLERRDAEGARALGRRGSAGAAFRVSSLGHAPRRHGERVILHAAPEPRGILEPIRWILSREIAA
ncbi:MAG TPA: hypothetical protein VJU87_04435 [Gemmatimonadaceae bacterium]|nr:hypothetical protein [Gemmatimonadaceae bacterium]